MTVNVVNKTVNVNTHKKTVRAIDKTLNVGRKKT